MEVILRAEPWAMHADLTQGRRPLLCAVNAGAMDVVRHLIAQAELDPNIACNNGCAAGQRFRMYRPRLSPALASAGTRRSCKRSGTTVPRSCTRCCSAKTLTSLSSARYSLSLNARSCACVLNATPMLRRRKARQLTSTRFKVGSPAQTHSPSAWSRRRSNYVCVCVRVCVCVCR